MNIEKAIGNMDWDHITALQQLCIFRKQQLRALEKSVYTVRLKKEAHFLYLIYRNGSKEIWGEILDPEVAIYPTFGVADYVAGQNEGSSVVKIPKAEFKTLPCFQKYLREGMINAKGDFN